MAGTVLKNKRLIIADDIGNNSCTFWLYELLNKINNNFKLLKGFTFIKI